MDKTPTKLLIEIVHPNKTFELYSNEIINLAEVKNKIKQELNIIDDQIKNITISYIDSDGDKNLILDNNDLLQFIMEQKEENEYLIKLRLELSENDINNNENIIQGEDKNIINKKKDENIIDLESKIKNYETEIKKLFEENYLLKTKINYYINRIKDLTSFYDKKLADLNAQNELFNNDKNAIIQKELFKSNENIFDLDDENNEKNEIIDKQKNEDDKVKNDNLNEIIKEDVKEFSNIYTELKKFNFKCNNCQNYCLEHIFICLQCNSFYLCNKCLKILSKIKHSHEKEIFFEIKFPKRIQKFNIKHTTINDFNEMLKNIFFEEDGNLKKSQFNLKDLDSKKIKILKNKFQLFYGNIKEYFLKYEKAYIKPELDKLEDKKKDLIKERIDYLKKILK